MQASILVLSKHLFHVTARESGARETQYRNIVMISTKYTIHSNLKICVDTQENNGNIYKRIFNTATSWSCLYCPSWNNNALKHKSTSLPWTDPQSVWKVKVWGGEEADAMHAALLSLNVHLTNKYTNTCLVLPQP